jgi:hypothetical protein
MNTTYIVVVAGVEMALMLFVFWLVMAVAVMVTCPIILRGLARI